MKISLEMRKRKKETDKFMQIVALLTEINQPAN